MRKCKHCNYEFDIDAKVFANHVRWCKENPNGKKTSNISDGLKKSYEQKFGGIKSFDVKCQKCDKNILVAEREKLHPEKNVYFCGRSCANSRKRTDEIKSKISTSLFGRELVERHTRKCAFCNKDFRCKITSKQVFCNVSCHKNANKSTDEFLRYKFACGFTFNVWMYPKEFDLELIRKSGWYQASNRGDNPDGVSRDHKISIKFGWDNNIPPELIAHPANCQLMLQKDNFLKKEKCSISQEELINKIFEWENKYRPNSN